MSTAKQNMFSIVLVGRQNPQILNHEFLVRNNVLPEQEPFKKELKQGENPFTEFFSTPPVARIGYGPYSLLVQEERYQAADTTGDDPQESPILNITKTYFGELLKYTPFTMGGLNLSGVATYDGPDPEGKLYDALGLDRERLRGTFASNGTVPVNIGAAFEFLVGRMLVTFTKVREADNQININFNYEFPYPTEMSEFLSYLDHVKEMVNYRGSLYERLGIDG